jgi:hypothetical protein
MLPPSSLRQVINGPFRGLTPSSRQSLFRLFIETLAIIEMAALVGGQAMNAACLVGMGLFMALLSKTAARCGGCGNG